MRGRDETQIQRFDRSKNQTRHFETDRSKNQSRHFETTCCSNQRGGSRQFHRAVLYEEGSEPGRARAYSILFGILPKERIRDFSAFDPDNDLPMHGFFVDDLFNLLGHDGTKQVLDVRRKCPDLSIQVGRPFRVTLLTVPTFVWPDHGRRQ